jgi:hypothetical protein
MELTPRLDTLVNICTLDVWCGREMGSTTVVP